MLLPVFHFVETLTTSGLCEFIVLSGTNSRIIQETNIYGWGAETYV